MLHIKGDNMKRVLGKVIAFMFYKRERKLPEVQIQVITYNG